MQFSFSNFTNIILIKVAVLYSKIIIHYDGYFNPIPCGGGWGEKKKYFFIAVLLYFYDLNYPN